MSLDTRLSDAIDALYEAALDPERWSGALSTLMALTGSQAASLWVLDGSHGPRFEVLEAVNLDPAFIRDYLAHMVPHDPMVQYLVANPHESIVHDRMVIDERAKDRHPYYQWRGRHSDTRFRLVGRVPASGAQAGVALHRRQAAGRYEQADVDRFAAIYRHLARALRIGLRLSAERDLLSGTTGVIAHQPAAIVFLDDRGCLAYANPAAEAYRTMRDGITLTADGFALSHEPDADRLRARIQRASNDDATGAPMTAMRVRRPSGKQPFTVLVGRLPRARSLLSHRRPSVLVMVADPERQRRPVVAELLASLFDLTQAEISLAMRLATGVDLRASAKALGITYGTARVRLASVFQKTDTHRQGELVRLLLTVLPLT